MLDVGALQRAVEAVVARHETLRSRFVPVDGEPVAVVGAAGPVPLRRVDLSGLAEPRRSAEVSRVVGEAGRRPFDLAVGPLTRWSLVRVSAVEHVLVVSAHHIV
ncbi:condensation domain-containing protein, partial [Modestobacter sp. Leaf380]|uniref:condensation domain-containing protein n=1 Tax=Modestobacter sp. Leaf380 TaxID=1736356 RepID=UPI00350F671B